MNQILDGAVEVFASRGFEKATLGAIADCAGVSRGLVYLYFHDKEGVHHAIKERGLRVMRDRFQEAADGATLGIDKLMAIGRAYSAFSETEPVFFEVMSRSDDDSTPSVSEALEKVSQEIFDVMCLAIATGMQDGSMRSDITNPLAVALSLWGATHGCLNVERNKRHVLDALGIDEHGIVDSLFELMRFALASREDNTPAP